MAKIRINKMVKIKILKIRNNRQKFKTRNLIKIGKIKKIRNKPRKIPLKKQLMYQNKTRKVKIISSKNNNKLKRIKIHLKLMEIIN